MNVEDITPVETAPAQEHNRATRDENIDRRAISWCAWRDLRDGIDHDDPIDAMRGWERAANKAAQHDGPDPLVEALQHIGISEAAQIYAQARAAGLISRENSRRAAQGDEQAARTTAVTEISERRKRKTLP